MNSQTDQQLLRDYTGRRLEAAFAELVRRHVDFVYSAALRMVRDAHLAEDVTQGVFVALAQNARQLTDHAVLSGWLHRTTQNLAANAVRADVRRRAREQEAAAMIELLSAEPDAVWEHIAPQLDEALGGLNEGDRDALLLRYFERKSAREMAQTLGTSEDAAQKRVSRAVERLREFFAKRGITVGASGLVVVITANAVQAAPVGLAATILTSATLVGTTIATTVTATKAIVMTTLQKTLITTTLVAAVGTGIYEARQGSTLLARVEMLQQQQAPLTEEIQRLHHERDDATNRLGRLVDEIAKVKGSSTELQRLRGLVGMLRSENQALVKSNANKAKTNEDQTLNKGFGTLGDFISLQSLSDAGNGTAEALFQTFMWALREGNVKRLVELGSPFGGSSKPGDVVGEIPEVQAAVFKTIQNVFTHSTGFRLSSKLASDHERYEVRLDAEPVRDSQNDEFMKNFYLTVALEQKDGGWVFGDFPRKESTEHTK